jgi:hypothetical protein
MPYVLGDGSESAPSKAIWANPVSAVRGNFWYLLNLLALFFATLVNVQVSSAF